jgi:hypothetical protein
MFLYARVYEKHAALSGQRKTAFNIEKTSKVSKHLMLHLPQFKN